MLADWRFWIFVAGIVSAIAEARFKILRHDKILDPDKIAEWTRQDAKLRAQVDNLADDVKELDRDGDKTKEKNENSIIRIWEAIETSRERIARMEGER